MATVKATFTLDERAVARLAQTAERLNRPKSEIVREAIIDFSERADRLSETERLEKLRLFDKYVPLIPRRPVEEVDAELADIRAARRSGGRRSPAE